MTYIYPEIQNKLESLGTREHLTKSFADPKTCSVWQTGKNASGVISAKAAIEEGDYWDNVAFVGKTVTGEDIIAVLPNALITSGFELEGKHKEGSVVACTFTCHAELDGDLDVLPWEIIYPVA